MKKEHQTQEHMFELIEKLYSEDINQKDFCEREGIKYHTLQYWLCHYRREKKLYQTDINPKTVLSTGKLIPIKIETPAVSSQAVIRIEYPNGVRLCLDETFLSQDMLLSLTQLISCLD